MRQWMILLVVPSSPSWRTAHDPYFTRWRFASKKKHFDLRKNKHLGWWRIGSARSIIRFELKYICGESTPTLTTDRVKNVNLRKSRCIFAFVFQFARWRTFREFSQHHYRLRLKCQMINNFCKRHSFIEVYSSCWKYRQNSHCYCLTNSVDRFVFVDILWIDNEKCLNSIVTMETGPSETLDLENHFNDLGGRLGLMYADKSLCNVVLIAGGRRFVFREFPIVLRL